MDSPKLPKERSDSAAQATWVDPVDHVGEGGTLSDIICADKKFLIHMNPLDAGNFFFRLLGRRVGVIYSGFSVLSGLFLLYFGFIGVVCPQIRCSLSAGG